MSKPTKDQIARAIEVLRKEGIDTAEKFEALLAASEARQRGRIDPAWATAPDPDHPEAAENDPRRYGYWARARSCHWHTHSMFYRCQNGLTLREYLWLPTPASQETS